jgi:hypothetical protein
MKKLLQQELVRREDRVCMHLFVEAVFAKHKEAALKRTNL